jgi:flagellar hook protein FlgE
MLRSLYSGVTGMKVNQVKMDVIGNNIANVGTTAFKSGRARFQDMLSQQSKEAMAPLTNTGGVNPSQVGLGVQLAGIDTLTKQGMMQPTGNNLDVAIDGDGYFVVGDGPRVTADTDITVDTAGSPPTHQATNTIGMNLMYTRDGSFTRDTNGDLLTSDGYRVMGYSIGDGSIQSIDTSAPGQIDFIDASKAITAQDGILKTLKIPDTVVDTNNSNKVCKLVTFSIGKDGVISGVLDDGRVTALGQIAMTSFRNPEGLEKNGKNLMSASSNSGIATFRSGTGDATADNSKGYGDVAQGMLEMSNVDLAEQFTDMIVTSRAFQANGKTISTGDEMLQDIINLKR